MVDEARSGSRGTWRQEADLRSQLEERTRRQDALWRKRARLVRWLFVGATLAVIAGLASWPEMRRAVWDLVFPPAADTSPVAPAQAPQDLVEALVQKASSAGQIPGTGNAAPGAQAPAATTPARGLDAGDLRFAGEVMQFLQPGTNQPPPPKPAPK